jgi:hypothetical protein
VSEGELSMLMAPLEVPVVPPSWIAVQLPSVWMLPTRTASEGTTEVALPPVTSIETSVTQTFPLSLQTFTCRVCQPFGAETGPFMLSVGKLEVLELLSRE